MKFTDPLLYCRGTYSVNTRLAYQYNTISDNSRHDWQVNVVDVPLNIPDNGETRQIWGIWKLRPAYSLETPNLGQNRWSFVPCDIENLMDDLGKQ